MAKKVNFENPMNIMNNDSEQQLEVNTEMLQAMQKAREEINGQGLNLPKKRGRKKTENNNELTPREVLTQKDSVENNPMNMSAKHEIVTDMKIKINQILPNIKIDLNNITISDSLNSLEKHTNLDLVFNSKPSFQVTLPQSCYTAYMEALKFVDIDTITKSTLDEYHTTLQMYQIIHQKIQATSIGPIDFDTFCECTSLFDLQNLFYALHMQTFPGSTTFDFKCVHCDYKFSQQIPNDSLIYSRDDKIFERLDEIAKNANTPEEVSSKSLISESRRVCLDESKTIIDVRIPSLKTQLEILKSVPSDKVEELSDDLFTLLFIKNVFILNVPETIEKNEAVYYPISGNKSKINVIKQLSISDSKQLGKEIDDWSDKYKIEYKIPNFKCPSCHKDLGNMPIDMENVLFRLMLNQ